MTSGPLDARHRTRRRAVAVLVAAVAALTLVGLAAPGCGISTDAAPRQLQDATTSTSTSVPLAGDALTVLWFVQGDRLVPVTRALPDRSDRAILESLLQPPVAGEGEGLQSSIPAGTELLELERAGNLLVVDLSAGFDGVVGPARQQAIGQIVLSETQQDDVSRLSFLIDGAPIKVTSPTRGDVDVVTACDYAGLLADPGAVDTVLEEAQEALLNLRRENLRSRCPTGADG